LAQKNQVDGELLITRLEAMGLVRTDEAFGRRFNSDKIVVAFIESAKKEKP